MYLKELNQEVYLDENIDAHKSPAIYFITTLYCKEDIELPVNWEKLPNSFIYTTEVKCLFVLTKID